MKQLFIFLLISFAGITANAQQDTALLAEYAGNYTFNAGDIVSFANITCSNGTLNYETNMGSGSLIKTGVDTFTTGDKKSTVIFVRDSANKVSGVVIDDVRGFYLKGKKGKAPSPTTQTKHFIEMLLQKSTYQLAVR